MKNWEIASRNVLSRYNDGEITTIEAVRQISVIIGQARANNDIPPEYEQMAREWEKAAKRMLG